MKSRPCFARVSLAFALCATASAQTAAPTPSAPTAPATPAAPASFGDAVTHGKISLNARLRYESVQQDALQDADALTARLRLGYTTALYQGFQAMVEGEATAPIAGDYYDGTGVNAAPASATIADPEQYDLNQAWLSYAYDHAKATVGRQRLVLDNARFVGDVGWRQNQQTFDAVVLQDKSFKKTTLTYVYLNRVNRVFDDSTAQYDWASNSHLFNIANSACKYGTLTAYGYLLDFDHLAQAAFNNSSQTYGLSFAGARPVCDNVKATYRIEAATQSDYGSSTLNYRSDYYVAELGAATKAYALTAGYEVLGSDHGAAGSGFKTPIATLHTFNGWADKFLTTPNAGLTDLYLRATATLPADLTAQAQYHKFGTTEAAADIGSEIDLQLAYKFDAHLSFTAKAAFYTAEETAAVAGSTAAHKDTTKFWLQAEYVY
ncbi:MAG: hypothetical protein RIQ79_1730 [Verrucomicrobiota bacterium]